MTGQHVGQEKIWDHFQNEGIDSFTQNQGRLEFLVRQLAPRARVLNIGVGNGVLETLAQAKGADVWSLDPNERAIERLRNSAQLGEKAQVGFSQSMPFQSAHFDIVVMSEVLEHLTDKVLTDTLVEVARVLKPNGLFIGTVPARERLEDSLVVCPGCGAKFHRWGHQRSFDLRQISDLLRQEFVIDEISEHFFVEWSTTNWLGKLKGLIKKFLSWRGIGAYGIHRNIFFKVKRI